MYANMYKIIFNSLQMHLRAADSNRHRNLLRVTTYASTHEKYFLRISVVNQSFYLHFAQIPISSLLLNRKWSFFLTGSIFVLTSGPAFGLDRALLIIYNLYGYSDPNSYRSYEFSTLIGQSPNWSTLIGSASKYLASIWIMVLAPTWPFFYLKNY